MAPRYSSRLCLLLSILVGLVIAFPTPILNCRNPLKLPKYLLFGTKTSYALAQRHVNKLERIPEVFGPNSFEEEHAKLVSNSYKPVTFVQFLRHAIRYPSEEVIGNMDKYFPEIVKNLKQKYPNSSKYKKLFEWKQKFNMNEAESITDLGRKELDKIVNRFKTVYPEFFDTEKTDFVFGFTRQKRTAESGYVVMKHIDNLDIDPELEYGYPDRSSDSGGQIELEPTVIQTEVPRPWMKVFMWQQLQVLKVCKKIYGGKLKQEVALGKQVRKFDPTVGVFRKLHISQDNYDEAERKIIFKTIFEACRYEQFAFDFSPWCTVFTTDDLKAIDYMEDVEVFLEEMFGPGSRPKMACPVIKEMMAAVRSGMTHDRDNKLKAHFLISHSDAFKKVMAALGVAQASYGFSQKDVEKFLKTGKAPDRDWITSMLIPFSTNLSLVLYERQGPIDDGESRYELLSLLNERPVRLSGCGHVHCEANFLLDELHDMEDCDLRKICARSETPSAALSESSP